MKYICPLVTDIGKDERFQQLKKTYSDKKMSDHRLLMNLQAFRENEDLDFDWYPETESDYKAFTNFLDRPKRLAKERKVSKKAVDELYKTLNTLYDTPAELNERVDKISQLFRDYVTRLVDNSSFGVSRQQAIERQGTEKKNGFNVILDKVFSYIDKLSTLEAQEAWYKRNYPQNTDAQLEADRDWLKYRADEYAKMRDNKDALSILASLRIGAKEGFNVNIDGYMFNFAQKENLEELSYDDNEEDGTDATEASKGDRYEDYRLSHLMSTISTEARGILEKINMIDRNGKIVRNKLGDPVRVNEKQAVITLHKVMQATVPERMMTDLHRAAVKNPWIKNLIAYLQSHPDDEATIYCNFKRARCAYFYTYKDYDGKLNVKNANGASNGTGLSREAGLNVGSGVVSAEKYNIVDKNGKLVSGDKLTSIKSILDRYQKFSNEKLKMKPLSTNEEKRKWTTQNASAEWKDILNPIPESEFQDLADVLSGIGFIVSAEDVKYALLNTSPIGSARGAGRGNDSDIIPQTTSLERLLSAINGNDGIISRAEYINKEGKDLTGSHLYNYTQDIYKKIADVLAPIQSSEVEERIISRGKSFAASMTPNALHDMVDKLSNVANLSDQEYREMIMNDYGQFEGMALGFGKDIQLTGWLADLYNDGNYGSDSSYKTMRKSFKVVDCSDVTITKQKDFARMTAREHLINSYVMYMRGTQNRTLDMTGHMYEVPIQADYETAYNFIVAPSYSYPELVERLAQEVECEAQRISAISERKSNDPADSDRNPIRPIEVTYEKNGTTFKIFPELNNKEFLEKYQNANPTDAHQIVKDAVDEQLRNLVESERKYLTDKGFFKPKSLKLLGIKDEKDKSINEWLLNAFYARQQMTKLLYGGLEHFGGVADFEKRNMYAHAPRIPLYTKAVYKGEQVGQENQRVIYLGDDKVKSAIFDNISTIAKKLNEQGKITKDQMNRMVNAYKSITTTDGQGLRTLDSMRKVKMMAGIWTDADETAYKHITSPDKNYTPEDVEHFIVGLKPVYTGYETLPAQPGKYQKPVRVPVLHKYSEMVLLPEMLNALNPQTATSPLSAMNKINEHLRKNNRPEIDLFLFGSCVKVGQNAVFGMFDKNKDGSRKLTDADSMAKFVTDKLDKQTFWIHSLPYKYYGLTASMHDNVVDEHIAWATQAQKQAWANINEGEELTVAGSTMKSTEARKLFYDIITARTVDTYKRINERLSDPKEVATLLKEEIASKPYKSRELIFALQGRDSGRFALPLYSPNIQHDVTALLASIVKKAFTKVPTKGANMTQTTSFGMDQEATGTYFDESMEKQGFSPLEVKFDDNGNFKYVEAYIPIHDSRLLKYADSNGNITPANLDKLVSKNIIPESILNFLAYRTPSDAEHSVIPCRIKGFISNAGGPSIRLPREIMAMTGHDYDGDKMRCHFKEFRTGWDNKAIRKDFETFSDTEAVQAILSTNSDPTLTPYEVFRRNVTSDSNPEAEKYRVIKSIDYDYSKTPLENIGENSNYDALNNALVDLLFAQLTSENGGLKMFIPGGSGETATYADEIGTRKQATEVSPFTVSHATESHGYMMEGANMIGVYAMYSSAGAMNQRIKLSYIPQTDNNGNEIAVTLFGKRIGELNPILTRSNSEDTFTTLTEARFVNAAVDNGKDPLLGYLNQTQELSALTNFLVCAGISEKELHLLLNQPVIIELASRLKEGTSFQKAASAINEELVGVINKKYDSDAKYSWIKSISAINRITSNTDNLTSNLNKSFGEILDSPRSTIESQVFVLQTLQYLNEPANDLSEFVKLTRPESDSGGIDASIGGIIAKRIQLENFRQRLLTGDVSISGMYDVLQEREVYENSMTPDIIQEQMGTALPEVVALNTLMKDSILGLLKNYFPQARNSWMDLQMRIANHYDMKNVKGNIIEGIGSDMILWKLLSNTAFITENPQEEQKRIIQNVPEQVRALKQRIEDAVKHPGTDKVAENLKDNIFIKNLELGATVNSENENISRLRFQLNGTSLEDTADTIRADWGQMLYTGDPEITQLAKDLFKYNLYTNGFNYGRYEFAHFAPYSILQSTPGYLRALNDVLTSNWAQDEENNFYHQYLRNHWGDEKLMPKFNPNQLPVFLRDQLGFTNRLRKEQQVTPAEFTASLEGKSYIVLNTSENNKPIQTLYELIRDDDGAIIALEKAEKLGIRNGSGQAIKQYNPSQPDYKLVKPTFIGNQVAWGVTEQTSDVDEDEMARQAAIDDQEYQFGPVPDVQAMKQTEKLAKEAVKHNDNISEDGKLSATDAAMFGFEEEEPVEETELEERTINIYAGTNENSDLSNFAERPFVIDFALNNALATAINFGAIYGKDFTFQSVEQAFQLAKTAFSSRLTDGADVLSENNAMDKITERIMKASPAEAKKIGREIPLTQEEVELWDKYSSTIMKFLIKTSFEQNPEALKKLLATGDAVLTHTQDKGKWGTEFPRILMEVRDELRKENGNSNKLYHLVERDENGNPITKSYPVTPGSTRKAREQKAFVELNERLREILREHGISIGALEEAEARLRAGGVTDFSTATVLAEGMKELIRLSNGIEGEYALPEEFAHVAVEMLGHDHPLVQRLLNILRTNDKALNEAFGDQLDQYSELYGNDREKLAVEAAGKLIAKQLFQHQAIKTAPVRSLISRICDAIKRFFRRMTTNEIDNAIFDAQGVASQLARDLLSGKMADELSLENITASDSFYKLEKDLSNQSDIRSKILKNTVKRLDIYKRRLNHAIQSGTGSTGAVDFTQRQIDKLERQAETTKIEISIADYLKDTMTFMKEMEDSLKLSIASSPANVVCRKLYIIKDTLYSFSDVIKSVSDAFNSGELERTEDLKKSLSEVSAKVTEFWTYYDGQAQKYLEKMLADVYGEDGVTVTIGKNRGRKITPHEMATKADHDISFFSRWFHAASDCDDFVIQAISEVTRDAKRNARERVAQRRSKLNAAIDALKKEQGNLDQSWMFERIDGKRTARYISEEKAKELSPARYNFYKTFMELKREADRFLPEMMTSDRKIIMFRKKVEEKIKAAEGFNATTSEIWDGYVKKAFVEMDVDKNDYDIEEEIKDFDDNIVDQLPIRFLNKTKKESFDDMTEDAATSLLAYMGMAFEYHEMNNVIGLIENARYASSLRDVGYRNGLRTLFEKRGSDKEFHYREPITRKQARTLIQKTIDDFIHMHVYGHLRKDYGTFGKTNISKRKVLDFIMGYTSLTQMGLNIHQRIANVNTGATQIIVEATGGKLKLKNVRKATGIWLAETAVGKKGEKSRLVESGKYDRTNKLTLWLDKFDIHQDNGNDNRIDYTKSRARKIFGRNMVYAGLQVGEDYLSSTTALAYAMQHKLKGPDGKESDMWDAYEVKYTDPVNKTGAYISLKSGYTKLDGSAITKEDEREFANEVIATNFALQGIYNTDDRSAMQYYALGALGIMYRKWIAPAMKRRFSGVEYSKLRDDYTQGYYVTAIQLIGNTAKDWFAPVSSEEAEENWFSMLTNFNQAKESFILNWNKLNDYEKGNVWKSVTELGVIFLLTMAAKALSGIPDDKDNDNTFLSWAEDMMLTQVLRLRAELSSMAPTPNMVNEFSRIASSPFAAFRTIKDSLGVFNLMWIPNYTEKIKTGRYAGHTKAHKYFMKLPIISFFRKFDKVIDPTDLINYYQNQNY